MIWCPLLTTDLILLPTRMGVRNHWNTHFLPIHNPSYIQMNSFSSFNVTLKNSQNLTHQFILHNLLPGLLVFLVALLIRLYLTYPVGNSGDEFERWYQSKRILNAVGMDRMDHHTLRWSVNIPVLIFQWLFGTKPVVYYLIPACFGALASLFVFNISRLITGLRTGFVSSFLFTVTPQISQVGSQLLTEIFSCTYLLGTAYFILRYFKNNRNSYLIFATIFMFLAYGSKEPNLFFLPGLTIYIYWRAKSLFPPVLFLSLLLLLFFVETAGVALYSGEFGWLGRINYLNQHMDVMQGEEMVYKLSDIWSRWFILPGYWQCLLVASLICGLFTFWARHQENNHMIHLITLMLISFSLISTFAIISIDPLRFAQPLRSRYLTVTIPFAVIIICNTLAYLHILLTPAVAILLCWFWATHNYQNQLQPTWTPSVLGVNEYQRKISDHWRDGYALLFKYSKDARLYRAVYLEDDIVFKNDGSVERIGGIPSLDIHFPTKLSVLHIMSRGRTPKGYLELTRKQAIISKRDFIQ